MPEKNNEATLPFTQGPWEISRNGESVNVAEGNFPDGPEFEECDDYRIADTDGGLFQRPHPERIANAKLIAAAPDMYAELERIRDILVKERGPNGAKSIDAVLAKATLTAAEYYGNDTPKKD